MFLMQLLPVISHDYAPSMQWDIGRIGIDGVASMDVGGRLLVQYSRGSQPRRLPSIKGMASYNSETVCIALLKMDVEATDRLVDVHLVVFEYIAAVHQLRASFEREVAPFEFAHLSMPEAINLAS